jgi:tRNA (cytidine/uridine-2'-O-)-methyltransferase
MCPCDPTPPPFPVPLISIALHNPQIPQNTGAIARLCASQRIPLHIAGRPAFRIDDKAVKRAGLDYWPEVILHQHGSLEDLEEFLAAARPEAGPPRLIRFTTKATRPYVAFKFLPGDCLLFGSETQGLPAEVLAAHPELCVTIPMPNAAVRSLNLSQSVAMGLGEALRQLQPPGWQ